MKFPFSNGVYDKLKFVALIVLPAIATLYLGLGQLWNWENSAQIAGSITLISTALGTILQISTTKYNNSPASADGVLVATGYDEDTGIPNLQMTITTPPEKLLAKNKVQLQVQDHPVSGDNLK